MNFKLNINIQPYSNVVIDCDSVNMPSTVEINDAIKLGILTCEIKERLLADRERERLVDEIELLMQEKEYDSLGLCEYLEVINLMRDTLLKCDTAKLRFVMDGLKQKPNKKE